MSLAAAKTITLRNRAIEASIWTLLGYGLSQFIRLAGNLVLTHLLFPEAFGLMTIVNVFNVGLTMFSDVGIGPSIIQNARGEEPDFYNTAWTVQIVRGIGLWLLALLISWPVALFYGEPLLRYMLPVSALALLINSFESTASFVLQRNVVPGKFVILSLVSQTAGVAVMVVLALLKPSVWALVVGGIITTLVRTVLSHFYVPGHRNRFHWDPKAAEAMLHFGKWILISSLSFFLAGQTDRLILGKLTSLKWLGVYSIAYALAGIPREVVNQLAHNVLFPVFSQLREGSTESIRAKMERSRRLPLIGFAVLIVGIAGFGDLAVRFLYDARYAEAAAILPVLALGLWPCVLLNTVSSSLLAHGRPEYDAVNNTLKFLLVLVGLPLGFYLSGTRGLVCVVASLDVPQYFIVNHGLQKHNLRLGKQDLEATFLFLSLLVAAILLRRFMGLGGPFDTLLIFRHV